MYSRIAALAGILAGGVLAGCSRAPADTRNTAETAATYKAGYGIRLNEQAAAFAGIELGEAESRDLPGVMGATVVPQSALLRTVRGAFVYVENGEWLLRSPVRTGVEASGHIEVIEGLYEGDRIATSGVKALWLAEISAVNGGVGCADGH